MSGESINEQARILTAFAIRMSSHDLRVMADLVDDCAHAGLNLGMSSQLAAHNQLENFCKAALLRVSRHDRDVINTIIQNTLGVDA